VATGEPAELLQVLDADGVATGETRSAEDVHAEGLWHGAVVVWVLRRDGGVLLRRNPRADPCAPLALGPTARAHAGVGPPAAEAAAAAERQLGIGARREGLSHLGTFRSERCRRGEGTSYVDREHQEAFVTWDDTPLEDLALDPAEVDTVYEVPLERAVALFESGAFVPAPGFDSMQRVSNALLIEEDLPAAGREELLEQLRALTAFAAAGTSPSD
jgi:hypothetical protein